MTLIRDTDLQQFAGDDLTMFDFKLADTAPVLVGIMLGAGWYAGVTSLLSFPAAPLIAATGGVALAAIGAGVVAVRQTARRHAQLLLPMQRKLQALEAHCVVSMVDTDGLLKDVNDLMLDLTGYKRADLIGQPVEVLYDREDKALAARIRSQICEGRTWQGETRLKDASGRQIFTQTTIMPLTGRGGTVSGSISVRTNTTHINQLLAKHHTMDTLNELRDDVWIVNAGDWRISYLNHAARTRLGCADGELPREALEEVAYGAKLCDVMRACRALQGSGDSGTRLEIVHDGVPLHVSIKQLGTPQAGARFLILMTDISDQIAQDRRKSEFVSTVSHELRAPLTSIKGALGLLLGSEDLKVPDKALALLEIAHRSSDRLILIINDILDLDKISHGEMLIEMQDTDVASLVQETHAAMQILQERFDVVVEVTGADAPLPFLTDPNRFIQVLTNLLSNACKFSPQGGRVTIEIEDNPDHVRVSVQDEGAGIPAAERCKIFQRFADMTNSDRVAKGGTGLGLSICKAIVENMGGSIGFQTREGAGTNFYFTLPRAVRAMPAPVLAATNSGRTIEGPQ